MSILAKVRDGKSAARQLKSRTVTHTLTEADAADLVARIEAGFDAVLGADAERQAQARRQGFLIIDGDKT